MGINLYGGAWSLFSRENLKQLIENSGFGIGIYDTNGTVLYYNKKALENIQLSEEEVIGKSILELFDLTGDEYYARIKKVVKTSKSHEYEDCIPLTSEKQWFVSTYSPVCNNDGEVVAVQVITNEITKQKNTEASLRESERKFKALSEVSSVGIYCTDMNGYCTYANSKWLDMAGIKLEDALGKEWVKAIHPADRDQIISKWHRSVKSKGEQGFEYQFQTPEGNTTWVYGTAKEMYGENGELIGYICNNVDITEKKKVEISLKESEQKFRNLVEQASDMLFLHDTKGQLIEVNNAAVKHTGYSRDELLKMTVFDIDPDAKDRDDMEIHWKSLRPDDKPAIFEGRHRKKDGGMYEVEITVSKISLQNGEFVLGLARDITEKKKAEENFKKLFENSAFGIVIYKTLKDDTGRIVDFEIRSCNKAAEKHTGLNGKELLGKFASYFGTQNELDILINVYNELLISGTVVEYEQYFSRYDAVLKVNAYLLEEDLIATTFYDITDRIKYEKEIQAAKTCVEQERNVLQEVMNGAKNIHLIYLDYDFNFVRVNETYAKTCGYSPEEMIGKNHFDLYPNDENEEIFKRVRESGVPCTVKDKPFNFPDQPERGVTYWDWTLYPVKGSKETVEGLVFSLVETTERKKTELILKESEEKFRSLVDQAAEMLFLHDTDGNIVDVNKAAVKNTGFKREELLKMRISDIDTDTEERDYKKTYWKSMRSEDKPVALEVQHKRRNGTIYPAEVTISKVFLSDGEYILALAKDITERKRAEETLKKSEAKYRLLFNSVPTGMGIARLDGTILQVNDVFCNMLGYKKDDFSKINIKDLYLCPDQREELLGLLEKNRSARDYEVQIRKKDGTVGIFLLNCDIITFDDEQVLLTSGKDITSLIETQKELKKAHDKLISLNKTLESKVEERTSEVKKLLQHKDEFINQMGHDLKNPLGPFVQLLPILRNHISDDKDREIIDVLYRNACYMRNLVKKTIDLAKLNSRKTTFTFEDVSLKDILDEVIFLNKSMFEENHIIVENNLSSSLDACVDSFYIQELLTNLLNNAVKYTKGNGKITIDADIDNDEIIISVKDTGIGISDQQMRFLFDEYYKADSSRHDFESSGLGLPICRRIVERHDGRIWAKSEGLGKGSTFYFTLPKK